MAYIAVSRVNWWENNIMNYNRNIIEAPQAAHVHSQIHTNIGIKRHISWCKVIFGPILDDRLKEKNPETLKGYPH